MNKALIVMHKALVVVCDALQSIVHDQGFGERSWLELNK